MLDDGDWVKRGKPVCTLDVNGVILSVVSEHDGFLTVASHNLATGETVLPGARLGFVTRPSEAIPEQAEPVDEVAIPPRLPVVPLAERLRETWQPPKKRRAASPRAKRAARDAGVPLRAIRVSGAQARITVRDVSAAALAIAAMGGAVVSASCSVDVTLERPGNYAAVCHQLAEQILASMKPDDLAAANYWEVDGLELVLARHQGDVVAYRVWNDDGSLGRILAEDDVETNLVPVYSATSPKTAAIVPPLPPGALFAIGFSSIRPCAVVANGKVVAGHVVTVHLTFDSQTLSPDDVERWLGTL